MPLLCILAVLRLTCGTLSHDNRLKMAYLIHRPHLMSSEGWLMISLYRSVCLALVAALLHL